MIPLVAPHITQHDRSYIQHQLGNGLLDTEHEVQAFEQAFALHAGCIWTVAVNSGTTALHLAIRALRLGPTLTIPTYACQSLLHAAHAAHKTCRFTDVAYNTETAEATQHQPAHITVHLFGRPTLTPDRPLIEDWTLSFGSRRHLQGDLGICSTHHTKMITTGQGGLIFGNHPELHDTIKALARYDTTSYNGGTRYSAAMSSTQAALGNSQLQQLDAFISKRRYIARLYSRFFADAGIPCPTHGDGSIFFRYLIDVDNPTRIITELAEQGIEAGRGVHPLLHQLDGQPDRDYPDAVAAHRRILSLPCHPNLTHKQIAHIIRATLELCA